MIRINLKSEGYVHVEAFQEEISFLSGCISKDISSRLFPATMLREIMNQFPDAEIGEELQNYIQEKIDRPIANFTYQFSKTPYQHQIEGIGFLLPRKRAGLFDEMGLGKTLQVLVAFDILREAGEVDKMIVICPKIVKRHWASKSLRCELAKHTPHLRYQHLQSNTMLDGSADIQLINYDILEKMALTIIDQIKKHRVLLVGEESHRIKNQVSQRGRTFLKLSKYDIMLWLMSGSPMINKPESLYTTILAIAPELAGSQEFFWGRYIKHNDGRIYGYKNLNELRDLMSLISLRRLKKDCINLPELLPAKNVYATMTPRQREIYDEMKEDFTTTLNPMSQGEIEINAINILSKITRLLQISAHPSIIGEENCESGKSLALDELLGNLIDEDEEKVIVCTNFTGVNDILMDRYARFNPVSLRGGMSESKSEKNRDKFNDDPECKLLIMHPLVGIGIDLLASRTIINYDRNFGFENEVQPAHRIHRIGQERQCSVINLIHEESIDEYVDASLAEKEDISAFVLGDEVEVKPFLNKRELMRYL